MVRDGALCRGLHGRTPYPRAPRDGHGRPMRCRWSSNGLNGLAGGVHDVRHVVGAIRSITHGELHRLAWGVTKLQYLAPVGFHPKMHSNGFSDGYAGCRGWRLVALKLGRIVVFHQFNSE